MRLPSIRCFAAAVALLCLAAPVRAADTELVDPSGVLHVAARGRWREQKSEHAIAATGFLGIKRAEFYATLYADETEAGAAAARWKTWRGEQGGEPSFEHEEDDASRFTAHSAARGTVDYVHVLAGAGQAAVVWLRVSGEPGVAAAEAADLLGAARLEAPKPPPTEAGGGPDAPPSEAGESVPGGAVFKDQGFRVQVTLPTGWELRKEAKPEGRRVLSARGVLGTDAHVYFDLYAFDSFLRADAAGFWWREAERRGWDRPVRVTGADPTVFRVDVQNETWTRHVRVVHTKAGLYGFKIDANSEVEKAALDLVERLLAGGLKVLKERPAVPSPPPGMKTVAAETVTMFHAGELGPAQAVLTEAQEVDTLVQGMLGLEPWEGGRIHIVVQEDAASLEAALRPLGKEEETSAVWVPERRVVIARAGVFSDEDLRARLREEVARAAIQLRFGFRPPYWLERGLSLALAGSAYHRGRTDLPHPRLLDAARNAGGGSAEFEATRWWTEAESRTNPERDAVVWSFAFLFTHGGPLSKKWGESFEKYVQLLRSTGDPVRANAAFDFAREGEFVDEWKRWVRKL